MALTTLTTLDEATFDESVQGTARPVLVEFGAAWCGPCHALEPILADLAGERAGSLDVATVDVDTDPGLARRFDVMSVPTLLLFEAGQPRLRLVGARGKARLVAEVDAALAAAGPAGTPAP
jgi:thioredoxin 1